MTERTGRYRVTARRHRKSKNPRKSQESIAATANQVNQVSQARAKLVRYVPPTAESDVLLRKAKPGTTSAEDVAAMVVEGVTATAITGNQDGGNRSARRTVTRHGRWANTEKPNRNPDALYLAHGTENRKTAAELDADSIVDGVSLNAGLLRKWYGGALDLTALVASMDDAIAAVNRGDMRPAESMLMSQAVALNVLFVNMFHRAHDAQYVQTQETNLRYGFMAQRQCRATLETLAVLKNPPVFAKQANVAQGPQQINNTQVLTTDAHARARNSEINKNKLSIGAASDEERVGGCASATTGASDTPVATVGTVNGTPDAGREGARIAQRVQRRSTCRRARTREATASALQEV